MKTFSMRPLVLLLSLFAVATAIVAAGPIAGRPASDTLSAAQDAATSPVPTNTSVDGIYISGTFSATAAFEASIDGTNWFAVNATPVAGGTAVTTTTTGGQWVVNTAGLTYVRVRCSAWTSGAIVVSMHFGAGSASVSISGTVTASGNTAQIAGTTIAANSGNKDAGTQRVVIATDQPSLTNPQPVSQSGTWNLTNISGTVSLPTGAATASLQGTTNTSLGTINTTLGSPFQAGGSIGNSSFGISGTLPAFASTPTVNAAQSGTWTVTETHSKTIKTASGTITSDTDVIAAVTSKRIKVVAYSIQTTDNTGDTCLFKTNGTGGTELWRVYLKGPDANTPYGANLSTSCPTFLFATAAGEKLTLDVSSAATIHYSITYWDDDAS